MIGIMFFIKGVENNSLFVNKKTKPAILLFFVLTLVVSFPFRYNKVKNVDSEYILISRQLINNVPENEKNSIYVYMPTPSL